MNERETERRLRDWLDAQASPAVPDALRGAVAAIPATVPATLSDRLAAALGLRPATVARPAVLLLVGAGLLAALVGGMLIVGSQMERRLPAVVPPLPTTATPLVTAAPTSTADTPSAAPTAVPPSAAPTSTPAASFVATAVAAASFPVKRNAGELGVDLAAGPDGELFVAIPAENGTVLGSLDAKGRVRAGWPVLLRKATGCELDADPADGSVRAVCVVGKAMRAFALDASGRLMAGWPVDLPAGDLPTWMSDPIGLVDGVLYAVLVGSDPASAMLVRVSRDGSVHAGVRVSESDSYAFGRAAIGPDGTGYVFDLSDGTVIWAIDLDGLRPGFPITIEGWASTPAFGPGGRFYMAVDDPDAPAAQTPSSQVVAFTGDGRVVSGWPATIPIDTWTGFGDPAGPPLPPVVASDGSVYVTGWIAGTKGAVAYALGPSGVRRPGWPYRSDEGILTGRPSGVTCPCEPCVFPVFFIDTAPLAGPDDSLVLVQLADKSVSGGNRIVAVGPDAEVRAGWPVTLAEKGSWFASIAVGADKNVYAYAVEPAGTLRNECGEKYPVHSGTVVALDGHGDTIYTTTIVAP